MPNCLLAPRRLARSQQTFRYRCGGRARFLEVPANSYFLRYKAKYTAGTASQGWPYSQPARLQDSQGAGQPARVRDSQGAGPPVQWCQYSGEPGTRYSGEPGTVVNPETRYSGAVALVQWCSSLGTVVQ